MNNPSPLVHLHSKQVGKQIKDWSRHSSVLWSPNMCYLCKCELAAVWHVSEKSTKAIHIYWLFQMTLTWAYFHPAFLCLRCTNKDWTIKWGFPDMDKMCGNKWEGNRVPLGERKLDFSLTKERQNYISHFVWYGVTVFKTQQLKPYKR